MKIPYAKPRGTEQEADLYVIGNSLGLTINHGQLHRIGPLTEGQWRLLAQSAFERSECAIDTQPIKFVAVGANVMQGTIRRATASSKTFAKRISNALNKHIPNREGV